MVNKVNKNFLKSSYYIYDLKLCSIRMIDNSNFPWIILIPKRKSITDITDLKKNDRNQLMEEIVYCSNIMKKVFKTSRLNVEKIGNIVPQLHIHIIARKKQMQLGPYLFGSLNQKLQKKELDMNIKKIREVFLKKRGDFSLPPSPHKNLLNDSLQFCEHLLVESDNYKQQLRV